MRYDVIWWLHNRGKILCKIAQLPIGQLCLPCESHMTNCYFERHMICQCRSYDLIQVPLQFSTGMSSSGGFILYIIKNILWYYCLFVIVWDVDVPIFVKMALQGGFYYPKWGVLKGVPFMGCSPWTWIILVADAGCLLFIFFSSSWIWYFNPLYSGH